MRLLLYSISNLDATPQAVHVWARIASLGARRTNLNRAQGCLLVACLAPKERALTESVPMKLAMALKGA